MNGDMNAKVNKGPRACATCARAKSRCMPGPDREGKCERCHRLHKPCSSQTPAQPRKRKDPKPTRVAELERRLQDLTARIELTQKPPQQQPEQQEQQQPPSPPESEDVVIQNFAQSEKNGISRLRHDGFAHLFHDQMQSPGGSPSSDEPVSAGNKSVSTAIPVGRMAFPPSPPLASQSDIAAQSSLYHAPTTASSHGLSFHKDREPPLWPEEPEATTLLNQYRGHMDHLFPFAIVPPGTTSSQLRAQRPLFWKAIMMEACHLDGARQVALGNELLREISEGAFLRSQKNLDLLQGLQVFVSWYHYNLNSFQLTNLLYLARSICSSLGLTELQRRAEHRELEPTADCLEHMRAYAGTYYLTTVTFTTNKKPDGMVSTPCLEACCDVLSRAKQYPTDELLVWLVRAQQLAQSISLSLADRNPGTVQCPNSLPLGLLVSGYQQQIHNFKASIPLRLRDNATLTGHVHVAEILLYEVALQDPSSLNAADQISYLWACVGATKAYLSNRFAATDRFSGDNDNESSEEALANDYERPRFICMSSFDFIFAFLTGLRLITFQGLPNWDRARVRTELCFDGFLERQMRMMEKVAEARKKRGWSQRWFTQSTTNGSSQGTGGPGGEKEGVEGEQDPYVKLTRCMRQTTDKMLNELDTVYGASVTPSTVEGDMSWEDATQSLMQDVVDWQGMSIDWNSAIEDAIFPGMFSV